MAEHKAMRRLAVATLCALAACTSDGGGTSAPAVLYQGAATAQSYQTVMAASAQVDDSQAPIVSVPVQGQSYLDTDAAPPFRWNAALATGAPAATATSGAVYVLSFTLPGGGSIVGVTTDSSFTPDPATWDAMKRANGSIQLEIVGAVLTNGAISTGPFKAASPRSFSVTSKFWP